MYSQEKFGMEIARVCWVRKRLLDDKLRIDGAGDRWLHNGADDVAGWDIAHSCRL